MRIKGDREVQFNLSIQSNFQVNFSTVMVNLKCPQQFLEQA